jgi:conjugative transfer region protein TrbK
MGTYVTSQRFLRAAAVVFVTLAVALAVVESRRGENATVLTPLEPSEAHALVREFARCRTIKPDETPELENCRRLWAENRRHFFASTKSPRLPDPPAPDAPAGLVKSQERIQPGEIEQNRTQ